jgi:ABC-2 type transport system ATP-binding protein
MTAIEFDGLSKVYRGGQGVRDLRLTVLEGEVFGFIGPNGAGKSTTIRTLLGLLRTTGGEARIFGQRAQVGAHARGDVGYVPSEPGVYERLTVGDMLAYFGRFRSQDTSARRAELCAAFDLDPTRRADDLSLGNRKKVALVAAMQHFPRLLVLDEPTSGLDPVVQQRLFELLEGERRRGVTVFFSSHVLAEVERVCNRVALIKAGRLVEVADVAALRARQTRRVHLALAGPDAMPGVLSCPGVEGVNRQGSQLSFELSAALPPVLEALAVDCRQGTVTDVRIDRPSLEEVVLKHYQPSEIRHE